MNETKLNIKNWAEEDRPREKMMLKGVQALSDAELVAILIGSGNTDETAVELARRILKYAGNNLNELGKLTISALIKNFKGIGEAKAITIAAALELGRRRKLAEVPEKKKILSSKDIFELFHPILSDLPHEEFWLLLLNRANQAIEQVRISQGGQVATVADTRVILKTALEKSAISAAVCHNHPSGSAQPSDEDKRLTQKLKTAFAAVDIQLIDHIIIAGNDYFSFADHSLI